MRVFDFYKDFKCLAGACRHSCCEGGWELDIDEDTCRIYENAGGDFGEQLRAQLEVIEEDGEPLTTIRLNEEGCCPFLNEKGLCRIILNLGEEAISLVCQEYPRYTQRMGSHTERTLSFSCEEVGRLLFSKKDKLKMVEDGAADDVEAGDEEEDAIEGSLLELIRQKALDILQNRSYDIDRRLQVYLTFCEKVQHYVNRMEMEDVAEDELRLFLAEKDPFKAESRQEGEAGSRPEKIAQPELFEAFEERTGMLECLEVLDDEWQDVTEAFQKCLEEPELYGQSCQAFLEKRGSEWEVWDEQVMAYFTYRYFPRALQDGNVLGKAQFSVLSLLVIRDMDYLGLGENRIETARKYSREVEHADDNVDALMEELLFSGLSLS